MNSRIYLGEVTHVRLQPVEHRFRYPVHFFGFDLDELPQLDCTTPLFGYNRLRPVAIHDRDYLFPGKQPIREKLDRALQIFDIELRPRRVMLVTAARYFNYVFNPISFFYCHDDDGRLACVLAQVNNTFGEMHLYLLPSAGEDQAAVQAETGKQFHVSPFFPRRGRYEFRLSPVGEQIDNSIRYFPDDQLALIARIRGTGRPLTPASLASTLLAHPFRASLTMPRILWQAARLYWQRRLPVYQRPVPNSAMTIRPVPASLTDRLGMGVIHGFLERLPTGELTLQQPDGGILRFGQAGDAPSLAMRIRDYRFYRRVMLSGDIGFGEAYTDGDWTTPDLPGLLTHLAEHEGAMNDRSILSSYLGRGVNFFRHLGRPNTVRGSERNIREHYDLSNDFFALFLDPTMTYSCALFSRPDETLEQAQGNKLQAIIDKARIGPDDHVLEVGCGWGSFAIEAVRRTGCRVTGITISRQQLELARRRVKKAGLEGRIEIRLCDYRHIEGSFDKLVSIEMLEAVGHAGLGPFFKACHRALRPGGRVVIQVITIPDRKYNSYRFSSDWIRKHIFPGGHLPSVGAMSKAIAAETSLNIDQLDQHGLHYAATLDRWRQTLLRRQEELFTMGFDEHFLRKWEYYFAYCQAGFAAGIIDLTHLVLDRPDHS
ncbi:MAG: DUF1365 family protein [Desulfuromonadales bacterium]|nr:DUF1365 family protein [Desulfuromonadales bacterium]